MKILLIFLLLISYNLNAQSKIKWIKTRSIEKNHSIDEWIAVDDSVKQPPDIIHDTIYLPQKQIDSILESRKKKPEHIILDSGVFTNFYVTYGKITYLKNTKKKVKKKAYDPLSYTIVRCNLDTLYGTIIYNDGSVDDLTHGNRQVYGYWTGYCPNIIYFNDKRFIPATYMRGDITFDAISGFKPIITKEKRGTFKK